MGKEYKWYELYNELGEEICSFYEEERKLTVKDIKKYFGNRLLRRIGSRRLLEKLKKLFPEIEKYRDREGNHCIDPVHIFASIQNIGLNDEERVELINLYFEIFTGDEKKIKDEDTISFDGNYKINISRISEMRNYDISNEIWDFFYILYKDSSEEYEFLKNEDIFEKIKNWRGIDVEEITTFMYWLNCKKYAPSSDQFYKHLKITKIESLDEYIKFLLKYKRIDFSRVVKNIIDGKENVVYPLEVKTSYFPRMSNLNSNIQGFNNTINLQLIAIKPLNGCDTNYLKTLKEKELYYFNNLYKINNHKETIDKKKDEDNIYSIKIDEINELKVSISSIVGKNGTGKSTIVELLIVAFNQISYHLKENEKLGIDIKDIDINKNINLELYVYINQPYCFKLLNGKLEVYSYKQSKEEKQEKKYFREKENFFRLQEFFYTGLFNYSLHCLNDNNLNNLYHKNDKYQMPLLIDPKRENGNIDINLLNKLTQDRLRQNLFIPCKNDEEVKKYRKLTEHQFVKTVRVKIRINKDKMNNIPITPDTIKSCLINLFRAFNIKESMEVDLVNKSKNIKNITKLYILKKLVSIITYHKDYQLVDEKKSNKEVINEIIEQTLKNDSFYEVLKEDNSQVTYKLRLALNFLKHIDKFISLRDHLENPISDSFDLILDEVTDDINEILVSEKLELEESINYMLPTFFNIEILMTDFNQNSKKNERKENSFNKLSSGEKHKLFVINSILYHLININSIHRSNGSKLVKYNSVNIILDEIELYFHPELQRAFISDLLENIEDLAQRKLIDKIKSIHILFVTHSPFILSDIPSSNLLLLQREEGEKSVSYKDTLSLKTFGANIHDLLANSFFLQEGTMGKYATKKIQEIIEFHEEVIKNKKDKKIEYEEKKDKFKFIVDSTGEKYIKNILIDYIKEIEEKIYEKSQEEIELEFLEEKMTKLKEMVEKQKGKKNDKN